MSTVTQEDEARRRSDDPERLKPNYGPNINHQFEHRDPKPHRKEDYQSPGRNQDFRHDGRLRGPPYESGRLPPDDIKYDPEFERSRYLKPPPLFPDQDRPPYRPRNYADNGHRNEDDRSRNHRDDFSTFPPRYTDGAVGGGLGRGDGRNTPDGRFPPRGGYSREPDDSRLGNRPRFQNAAGGPPRDPDPSRFDDYEAWRQLTRPPIPIGGQQPFGPMGFGYPPFRGPSFGGGSSFMGQGIGTILPVKKPRFKLLFSRGGFRNSGGTGSMFGGQQGWYCPCNYYPPAGRFVTSGYPGFWGGLPGAV